MTLNSLKTKYPKTIPLNRNPKNESLKNPKKILDLPDEILLNVFSKALLSFEDIKKCNLVCKQWRRVILDKQIGTRFHHAIGIQKIEGDHWIQNYNFLTLNTKFFLLLDVSHSMFRNSDTPGNVLRFNHGMNLCKYIALNILQVTSSFFLYTFGANFIKKNIKKLKKLHKKIDNKSVMIRKVDRKGTKLQKLFAAVFKQHFKLKTRCSQIFCITDALPENDLVMTETNNIFSKSFEQAKINNSEIRISMIRVGRSARAKRFLNQLTANLNDSDDVKRNIRHIDGTSVLNKNLLI